MVDGNVSSHPRDSVSRSDTNWRDFLELCKPRVVALMLVTAIVGMYLATPGAVPLNILIFGTLGIAFAAGSAAVINHLVDRRIDAIMNRTKRRPIVTGKVDPKQALIFSAVLAMIGMYLLVSFVNVLTAVLTFATLVGYAVVYTMYLKRATSQNIVIGGIAGAAPPLLGWTAVTGHIDPNSLLLVLIIFTWTPPHFWALAIHRYDEYIKADIPMLTVTHGVRHTKLNIVLYTLLMIAATLLPFVTGMSGYFYFVSALILGGIFLAYAVRLYFTDDRMLAFKTFKYSIIYLFLLFIVLLIDHYL